MLNFETMYINFNKDSYKEAARLLIGCDNPNYINSFLIEQLESPFISNIEQAHIRGIIYYVNNQGQMKSMLKISQ